jgi:hypothetical protein
MGAAEGVERTSSSGTTAARTLSGGHRRSDSGPIAVPIRAKWEGDGADAAGGAIGAIWCEHTADPELHTRSLSLFPSVEAPLRWDANSVCTACVKCHSPYGYVPLATTPPDILEIRDAAVAAAAAKAAWLQSAGGVGMGTAPEMEEAAEPAVGEAEEEEEVVTTEVTEVQSDRPSLSTSAVAEPSTSTSSSTSTSTICKLPPLELSLCAGALEAAGTAEELQAAFDGSRVTAAAFGRDSTAVLKSSQLMCRVNGAVYRW